MQVLALALALSLTDTIAFSRDLFVVRSLLGVGPSEPEDEESDEENTAFSVEEFRKTMAELREQSQGDSENDWE